MTSLLQMWWKGIQSLSEFDILQHLLNPGYGYDTSHLRPIKTPNHLFIDVQGGAEVLRQKLYYQYQNIFSLIYILGAIVFHKLIFRIYLNTNVLGLQGSLSLQCSNILVQKMRETSIASESSMVSAYFRMRSQDGGRLGIQREAPQLIAWSLWESPCLLEWGWNICIFVFDL